MTPYIFVGWVLGSSFPIVTLFIWVFSLFLSSNLFTDVFQFSGMVTQMHLYTNPSGPLWRSGRVLGTPVQSWVLGFSLLLAILSSIFFFWWFLSLVIFYNDKRTYKQTHKTSWELIMCRQKELFSFSETNRVESLSNLVCRTLWSQSFIQTLWTLPAANDHHHSWVGFDVKTKCNAKTQNKQKTWFIFRVVGIKYTPDCIFSI